MDHICYISIGTNLGDRIFNSYVALAQLELHVYILDISSFYESEAWGYQDDKRYINFIVKIKTDYTPTLLLSTLKSIELNMGRTPCFTKGYESRVIDFDIIFYDHVILNQEDLTIPHPRLYNRRFVLEPLSELNPLFMCPVKNRSIYDLLLALEDKTSVDLYTH